MIEDCNATRQAEELRRVPFNATSDTDGDGGELMRNELPHTRLRKPRHNHFTRDMKSDGSCPACKGYFDKHGIPEEEQ